MPHSVTLITTIAVSFGLALLMGLIANRLKLPVLLGYLTAGVILGSNTPGFVADMELSGQLAEIGVILLMFGVGLHFSLDDLLAVRRIALPGALVQIAVATAFGAIVAASWGWNMGVGIVFGVALSTASTVVLLRALEQRGLLKSVNGSIAVGWLIVEDLAMVLVLVLLPPLAGWMGVDPGSSAPPGQSDLRSIDNTSAHLWQGIDLCCADAYCGETCFSLVALARCQHELEGTLHPECYRGSDRHCLWIRYALRCLLRTWCFFCRNGNEGVRFEPPGRSGIPTVTGRIFGIVFCFGGNAV